MLPDLSENIWIHSDGVENETERRMKDTTEKETCAYDLLFFSLRSFVDAFECVSRAR